MSNKFLSARSRIEELLEKKEEVIESAGNELALVMIEENQKGITNTNNIKNDIQKLLNGFTLEEKNKILMIAMAKVIANI